MKNTKKLLALVLALVMAFSLMAVTAAAYGAEEHDHDGACSVETIQPRKPGAPECIYCGHPMTDVGSSSDADGGYNVYECKNSDCKSGYTVKVYW